MKKGTKIYERNSHLDWRHAVHKCPDCGKLTAYNMPIITHVERCYNPKCKREGLKR